MHADVKIAAQENVDAVETIREETRNTTADIEKSTAVGEEVETAAKDATNIGKTVAGMTTKIKNKGSQINAIDPMSYAAVAAAAATANGPLALSIYNPQGAKALSVPSPT